MNKTNTIAYAQDVIDAVNMAQPDAYGILRNPNDHRLCMVYMGRFMPLHHFSLRLQSDDDTFYEADVNTMAWNIALSGDPDVPASANLVILDQQDNIILSSDRNRFRGQLWLIEEGAPTHRARSLHAVFGYGSRRTKGSLIMDSSPTLAAHWELSAKYLRPECSREDSNATYI